LLSPHATGDPVHRDDLPASDDQDGEHSTLATTAELDLDVALRCTEPAQNPDSEPAVSCHPTSFELRLDGPRPLDQP
jgi:hypothetical protein